ncbi:hypothetical protein [Variovorax atrisoli]|uniref:hypothetical protein n=1 Tax=Variovorax atrisoli TaxID=3394203 RepID=UPI001427C452|nr:hypothetical protein [Variovorax paradoxus]
MDIARIQRSVFYRYQHVTGSTCVLVSIRFGTAPPDGPRIVRLLALDRTESVVQFDLSNHVSEILSGVGRANSECGAFLEVEAIEVVPDDHPGKGQVEHIAYQIALAVGQRKIWPQPVISGHLDGSLFHLSLPKCR